MRFVFCLLALLASQVCVAETVCQNGQCRVIQKLETATAQGVANTMARLRKMAHLGGNRTFEGVGAGATPEQALRNCCNNGKPVIDEGVALGSDGRWYACRRYSK